MRKVALEGTLLNKDLTSFYFIGFLGKKSYCLKDSGSNKLNSHEKVRNFGS